MAYFYARQLEALMKQCIRVFSNFQYKTGNNAQGPGELLSVPCKYGDASRMVAQIIKNNSENTAISCPAFAVYIKDIEHDPSRRKGPVLENQLNVTERAIDPETGRYTDEPGNRYEVDLLMPVPSIVRIQVDLLTSNTEQLWQLFEQVTLLFNPAIDIQTNDNALDWSSLTYMELESMTYNSRTIPNGNDDSINVTSWTFKVPFWMNPPAKVKKVIDIRNIISTIGPDSNSDVLTWNAIDFSQTITSAADYKINISGNSAILLGKFGNTTDENANVYPWKTVIDSLGKYDPNSTLLRVRPGANIAYASADVLAHFTYDEEVNKLDLTFVESTLPSPTLPGVTGIIDPRLNYPGNGIASDPAVGTRYLILTGIPANTAAWGTFSAPINTIIQWDGSKWFVAFAPADDNSGAIIQNLSNGKLYVLIQDGWVSAVEGTYSQGYWDIVFFQDTVQSDFKETITQ